MDKTSNYYSDNAIKLSIRYESADVTDLQNSLLSCFKGHHTLLEIGCGSGRDAAFMTSHGFHVTVLDGSEKMINSALKLHPELKGNTIVAALPEDIRKIEGTFDGIYSIAALMHLKKRKVSLLMGELSNLLNPGGVLFFSISITRDDINESGFDKKGRFFLTLRKEEWASICKAGGFKEKSITLSGDGLGRDGITWLTCIFEKG